MAEEEAERFRVLRRVLGAIARRRFLKEAVLLSAAYFAYMFTRKLVFQDVEGVAIENALKLVSLEVDLGFFWEFNLQMWLLERARHAVVFLNWSYIFTFFPIIIPVAVIVYKLDFEKYIYYRNIVLLSMLIALMVYVLFPLAPPRMVGHTGVVDTIRWLGPSQYNDRINQVYYNPFAAMPSIHFGWTFLFGIMFFRSKRPWLRVLGVVYPSLTFFAIVITGNHYITDAFAGAAVVSIAFLINALMVRKNIPLSAKLLYQPVRSLMQRGPGPDRTPAD